MSNAGCRTTPSTTRKTTLKATSTTPNSRRYRSASRRRARANTLRRQLFARPKAVASSSDGLDQPVAAAAIDLAAEAPDVDLDDVRLGHEVRIPDGLDEALLREHLARMAREHLEQRELLARQADLPACPVDLAGRRIQPEIADSNDRRWFARTAPAEGSDSGQQLRGSELFR